MEYHEYGMTAPSLVSLPKILKVHLPILPPENKLLTIEALHGFWNTKKVVWFIMFICSTLIIE